MRVSRQLLENACRITLFTRPNCGLCVTAKDVLKRVQKQRSFDYEEIDIAQNTQTRWKNLYDFDVPVIHVEKAQTPQDGPVEASQKLMHRFSEEQVISKMDEIQRN